MKDGRNAHTVVHLLSIAVSQGEGVSLSFTTQMFDMVSWIGAELVYQDGNDCGIVSQNLDSSELWFDHESFVPFVSFAASFEQGSPW